MTQESLAFQELRPPCIDLSRLAFQPKEAFDPHSLVLLDALKVLESKLGSYNEDVFSPKLADYIFIPISSLLKQDSLGEGQTAYVLLIISHLLRLSWRTNGTFAEELAQQLLPLITFLISQERSDEALDRISTGIKNAGSFALFNFAKSLDNQSYSASFFSSSNPNNLSSLGYCITILLAIIERSSQNPEVQLLALDALEILYQSTIRDGELLSFVVPGNISSFCKVLMTPGLTTSYKIVLKTLQVMQGLLVIVYDDLALDVREFELTDIRQLTALKDTVKENTDLGIFTVNEPQSGGRPQHRTSSWLRATSSQIRLALSKILPRLQKRRNKDISSALANFASVLLTRCRKSLHNCEYILVSTLVDTRMDPNFQLAAHVTCLQDIMKTGVRDLGAKIRFEDTESLRSLDYAILCLRESTSVEDIPFLEETCSSLVDALESSIEASYLSKREHIIAVQDSNVIITDSLEEQVVRSGNTPALFSNISKDMETSLGQLLRTLGSFANKFNQLDHIIRIILSAQVCGTKTQKTVALWTATLLVLGLRDESALLEDTFLNLDYTENVDTEACYDILEFGNNLAQEVVMSTEGVGFTKLSQTSLSVVLFSIETVCTVLGSDFSSELVDYLYMVVESLASPYPVTRHYAQSCALTIAHWLYNDSLQRMILDNVDYLAEAISSRLKSGMTERVSTVFMVVCKIAGYETIETFKDIIETIFKLLDYYHGYDNMCLQFFELFETIALEIKKRYWPEYQGKLKLENKHIPSSTYAPWGMTDIQQVLSIMHNENRTETEEGNDVAPINEPRNFQEYFDSKLREADSDDEEDVSEELPEVTSGGPEDGEKKWSSPIPPASYRILLQIVSYGDRLLTHRSKPLRVQILRTLKLTVPMLASQHDSFLPQVAQFWNILVLCSMDDDFSIVKPACECLQIVILHAGDFIMTRFQEFWNTLQEKSVLLRQLKVGGENRINAVTSVIPYRTFPAVTRSALISLCNVLLEGIVVTGLMLPDVTVREMIHCCLQVLPAETIAGKSIAIADIVYAITHEI